MYIVIMAGGSGTRFWPQSREGKSKQFLKIFGKHSLVQSTILRFHSSVPWENIYIVAKNIQREEMEKHLLEVPKENVLYEPLGKNTAPCIGLAAMYLQRKDADCVMVVSPADHIIQKQTRFNTILKVAAQLAREKEGLITIGIKPDRPATGYGYIQINGEIGRFSGVRAYHIKTFAEKPNLATAQRFLSSGDFFWNSGLFIFRVSVFLKTLKKFLPDLYDGLVEIQKYFDKTNYEEVLEKVYRQIRSISIDYGIMEKANNVYLVQGNFIWNDLGSWDQVYKLSSQDKNGNVTIGESVLINTSNSYIYNTKGVIAVVGLEDVVVVQEGGATLICKREKAEEVKRVIDRLKSQKLHKYL